MSNSKIDIAKYGSSDRGKRYTQRLLIFHWHPFSRDKERPLEIQRVVELIINTSFRRVLKYTIKNYCQSYWRRIVGRQSANH